MSDQQQQQQRLRGSSDSIYDKERDDDEQSIIDVFEFDDTAQDRWLCSTGTMSRRNSSESKIEDLDAWLHADVFESETVQLDNSLKKSIDTRTFTRIKRRSNRLSFETNDSSVSPETMPLPLSSVWKNQVIPEISRSNINNNNNKDYNICKEKRDNVPMMLRPKANQVLAALLSDSPSSISSQTSMEAFMNMAHSKDEITSFLSDMSEPDVSHFLMNVSQPSLLFSSIISDGKGDENIQNVQTTAIDSFADSQILTESMMEASMFKEVQDTTMLADFLKHNNDCTIVEDKTICENSDNFDENNKTFVNDDVLDRTYVDLNDTYLRETNETFVTIQNVKEYDTFTTFPTFVKETNVTKLISENLPENEINVECVLNGVQSINSENKTDLTFSLQSIPSTLSKEQLDTSFQASNFITDQIPRFNESENPLDTTFDTVPNLRAELLQEVKRSSANKFDTTFTNAQFSNIQSKFDDTYDRPNSTELLDSNEFLDSTYVQIPSLEQLESQNDNNCLKKTYDSTEIKCKPNNTSGMSYSRKKSPELQISTSDSNRYNTFRKDSKVGNRFSKAPQQFQENYVQKEVTTIPLQPEISIAKDNENLYQQRFNTYSKKIVSLKNNIHHENNIEEKKLGNKFAKPVTKTTRQIQAPRQLSKLPQLFQKSNPNLVSNIKLPSRLKLDSDAAFNKGSQPNISSNIQILSRFKSEQRLPPVKHNAQFVIGDGTSRSMESIESTASAPDFDDRLSACSDNSRASYTIKPKNIEILKKMANVEDTCGKFSGSTPKVKERQILENTWVEEKDLPSPIMKNGTGKNYTENIDSRSTSPADSAEFSAKTSSPLTISPTNSDQALNAIGNDDCGIEASKENIQATQNIRPKQLKVPSSASNTVNATKLRRPSNWTTAPNKVANGAVSGIPRPASRIPAPKFSRPNLK